MKRIQSRTWARLWGKALCLALVAFTHSAFAAQDVSPASFEVEGETAYMSGEIDESSLGVVTQLLNNYPALKNIVMINVPGSDDDETNVRASLLVHQRGMTTYVPADGLIASGGADFFLAGRERIVEEGACVGVHSWSDDDLTMPASQLPRDHPGHQVFLEYFRKIGMNEEFYWYTLQAAPAEGMYYMTPEEMLRYKVATRVTPPTQDSSVPCTSR